MTYHGKREQVSLKILKGLLLFILVKMLMDSLRICTNILYWTSLTITQMAINSMKF